MLQVESTNSTSVGFVVGRVHVEAVRTSLERCSVSAECQDDMPGLVRAAMIGHTDAVLAFLERGLDVNATDSAGRTPLMEAIFGGHLETALALLKLGADVNAQDRDGWTPLMEAASKGRADFVRLLLARGADPRARNHNGWTALKTTAKCNFEVSRLLRAAGANR
jgi:hypothetical protein